MREIESSPTRWKVPAAFLEIIRSISAPHSAAAEGVVTLFTRSPPNTVKVFPARRSFTKEVTK